MVQIRQLSTQLDRRRRDLGMSCLTVARRAALGLRTVQRVMSGMECDFTSVARIADAMGASIQLAFSDMNKFRRRQAESKAERIVGMVQGTMGLEAQAVQDTTLRELKDRTVRDLLAGSNRKLWGN